MQRNESHDLRAATDELISSLAQGNRYLGRSSGYDNASVAGRRGLRTILSNQSEATNTQETIEVFTTLLRDGGMFYMIGVAPVDQFRDYQNVFQRIASSIQLLD